MLTPAEAMFLDGYDEESKTVYQFQGCFYHGCIKCFPNNRHRKHNCHPDRTISEIYEATRKKTEQLRQAGYTVIEKWERQFENEKKTDKQLQDFLKTFELVESLNPRDAFFGGRTNGVCLHAKTKESNQFIVPVCQQNQDLSCGPSRNFILALPKSNSLLQRTFITQCFLCARTAS